MIGNTPRIHVGLFLGLMLALPLAVTGCAGLLVGGAATGAAVANDARTTGTLIEDQAIEVRAARALSRDDEIDQQAHINVTSYNEVVLLTGQAPNETLRERAGRIVAGVAKVRHVYNEIEVAAPSSILSRSNDTMLGTKVKAKLFTLSDFDATRVKVVAENDVVYLMGILTEAESDKVAEYVSRIGGVQRVVKLFEYKAPERETSS